MIEWIASTVENRPVQFGLYHICCIIVLITLAVLICIFAKKVKSEKLNKIILLSAGSVMLFFEILKQIIVLYSNGWVYDWFYAPLVPCSIGMYVIFITAFLKDGWLRKSLYWFLGTFCLFMGITAYVVASGVFNTPYIVILAQTMIHHGLLVLTGIYVLASGKIKFENIKTDLLNFTKGIIVFGAICIFSVIFNIIGHFTFAPEIDMMYLSPYVPSTLPLVSDITAGWPFIFYLIFYVFMFTLAALVIYFLQLGIIKLIAYIKLKKEQNNKI